MPSILFNWFRPELRVLFVCSANICRSPLAEAMLRRRLQILGLGRKIRVGSAGTRVGQRGQAPDPRVRKLAVEVGVPLGRIRARPLTPAMLRESDFVLVMEGRHLEQIRELLSGAPVPAGVRLLGSYLKSPADPNVDIPDPYFGDALGFQRVFEQLDAALVAVVDELLARLERPLDPPDQLSGTDTGSSSREST